MVTIKYDNQGDAISRDVPADSLALIDTLPLGVAEREALLGGTAARLFFG